MYLPRFYYFNYTPVECCRTTRTYYWYTSNLNKIIFLFLCFMYKGITLQKSLFLNSNAIIQYNICKFNSEKILSLYVFQSVVSVRASCTHRLRDRDITRLEICKTENHQTSRLQTPVRSRIYVNSNTRGSR